MKNTSLFLKKNMLALGLAATLLTQVNADSSFIAYQGVAYDNGVPKGSANIDLNLTIKQSNGTIVYSETQSGVTTTDKGFFSVEIGNGTRTDGAANYSSITWADNYKLNVQVNYGAGLVDLGDQNLTSTAYALKAKTADSATTATSATTAATTSGNAATATTLTGLTSSVTELNKLDGFTGDYLDLNYAKSLYDKGVTSTEFDYLDGVTSSIQTQLNGKSATHAHPYAPSSHTHTGSTISNLAGTDITSGTIDDAYLPASISSDITGNAATATSATTIYAQKDDFTDATRYLTFVGSSASGNQQANFDTQLSYNPRDNRLTASIFDGSLFGNASTALAFNNTPTKCATGSFTAGINVYGNAEGCTALLPLTGGTLSGGLKITGTTNTTIAAYYFRTSAGSGDYGSENKALSLHTSGIIAATGFNAYSDKRIKTDIKPIVNSLEIIKKLQPSSYTKIDKVRNGSEIHYGFIAQELEEVIPQAVSKNEGEIPLLKNFDEVDFEDGVEYTIAVKHNDGTVTQEDYNSTLPRPDGDLIVLYKKVNDFRTVDYDMVFTHAVAAIQEQQVEIQTLQDEIAQIKEALKASGIELK